MFTVFESDPISNRVNDYTDLVQICVLLQFMCALSAPMLTFGPYNLEFTQENDLVWLNIWKPYQLCISL